MTPAVTATSAAALMIACAAEVAAQTSAAISDTSIRPAEITCQELLSATEQERASIVYFIAGYQAAMEQASGQPGGSADVTGAATSWVWEHRSDQQ
jgi:hypothetical protein